MLQLKRENVKILIINRLMMSVQAPHLTNVLFTRMVKKLWEKIVFSKTEFCYSAAIIKPDTFIIKCTTD